MFAGAPVSHASASYGGKGGYGGGSYGGGGYGGGGYGGAQKGSSGYGNAPSTYNIHYNVPYKYMDLQIGSKHSYMIQSHYAPVQVKSSYSASGGYGSSGGY